MKKQQQRDLLGKQFCRVFSVSQSAIDVEKRTVEIAFASEMEGDRGWYREILDCGPGSCQLERLNDGGAVLINHNVDEHVGVVEKAWAGEGRVMRALVRFSAVDAAEKEFVMVQEGVRRHVSVRYVINDLVLEREVDDVPYYRIKSWTPIEASFVSIPFDYGVGVGRSFDLESSEEKKLPLILKETAMTEEQKKAAEEAARADASRKLDLDTRELDIKRRDGLINLGAKYAAYVAPADVQRACQEGTSLEAFQEGIIAKMTVKHSDTRGAHIGLSDKEIKTFSLGRAFHALATGRREDAGLEFEASDAAVKMHGLQGSRNAIYLPFDVFMQRDFNVGTASQAGNLVAKELRTDLFVDVLRNKLALTRLGVTMLYGLTGNLDIPKKATKTSLSWLTEVQAAAETGLTTGLISLTPKRAGAELHFSKQANIQSAMALDPLLRGDLLAEVSTELENVAINGTGVGQIPRGLRNTSGIGSVAGGTNGAAPSWGTMVDMESAVASVNAEPDRLSGYLLNSKTRGALKKTQKAANLPFVWDNGAVPVNGYRAEVTNMMPSNLTKGTGTNLSSALFSSDWSMLMIAMFGAVEIIYDEVTKAADGRNRYIVNIFSDVAVRRTADFVVCEDIITA